MERVVFDLISFLLFFKYWLGYNLFIRFGWPKVLPSFVTFSVNNYCNQRCKTCNIWKYNPVEEKKKELRLDEIEKIFSKIPKIFWLTITGGEPFLRDDLVEIVKIAYEKSKINVLTITTNGSMPELIEKNVKKILENCKNLTLIVNVSIDCSREFHDIIRGIDGSFDRAIESIERLKMIRSKRLIVGVNTTLSLFNINNLDKLLKSIKEINPDSFVACVAQNRVKLNNLNLIISPKQNEIKKSIYKVIRETRQRKKGLLGLIKNYLRLKYYYYIINPVVVKNIHNFEGIASVYIMSNGDIYCSEVRPLLIGNLKEKHYNVLSLFFSISAKKYMKILNSYEYKSNMMENPFIINQILNLKIF
jgi:MoaA/NifB/PqqE/SkfB family radical SAM enzyme